MELRSITKAFQLFSFVTTVVTTVLFTSPALANAGGCVAALNNQIANIRVSPAAYEEIVNLNALGNGGPTNKRVEAKSTIEAELQEKLLTDLRDNLISDYGIKLGPREDVPEGYTGAAITLYYQRNESEKNGGILIREREYFQIDETTGHTEVSPYSDNRTIFQLKFDDPKSSYIGRKYDFLINDNLLVRLRSEGATPELLEAIRKGAEEHYENSPEIVDGILNFVKEMYAEHGMDSLQPTRYSHYKRRAYSFKIAANPDSDGEIASYYNKKVTEKGKELEVQITVDSDIYFYRGDESPIGRYPDRARVVEIKLPHKIGNRFYDIYKIPAGMAQLEAIMQFDNEVPGVMPLFEFYRQVLDNIMPGFTINHGKFYHSAFSLLALIPIESNTDSN